jgi:hypothetical protein
MGRKPDIQRLLFRYADLNPPLGYPGGSCHLQDRIRQEVSNKRNQNLLLDHHLSGGDKKPNDRYERAIYDSIDEGPVKGTSFRRVLVSEHAQYRMDQRGITVPDLRSALRAFQKDWGKERSRGITSLTRLLQQPNEFHYDYDGIRFFMRPLKLWTPKDKKVDVWIRTLYDPSASPPRPVAPDECKNFPGWSKEYPEHGFDRLFPKRVAQRFADLAPPLGFPGGSCHLIERVHDEVNNPRLRDRLVDSVEEGQSLSNADASKVYSPERERGVSGKRLNKIILTSHVQYRMDLRGITVPEIRLALKQFAKAYLDERSRKSLQARWWDEAMAWGEEIKWEAPMGLVVVFTLPSQDTANIITAYWPGQSDPRPRDETECGFPSAGRVSALKMAPVPGVQTFVTEKSQKGLPTDSDREKQVVLPPGSATPGGEGREIGKFEFNTPDADSDIKPRTLGIPGEEYGHPSNDTYNTVSRRTMTAGSPLVSEPAYGESDAALPRGEEDEKTAYAKGDIRPSGTPGGQGGVPQREQEVAEKRKRKRRHEQNRGRDNQKALKRYHAKYKKKRQMVERKDKYRQNPRRYRRKTPQEYERPDKTAVVQRYATRLWYHGSPKRFEGFKTYEGHTFGKGPSEVPLFFSPSKSFAKMYATGPEGTIYAARLKWRKVFDGADLYRESRYWPPEYEDLTPEGKALYDDLADGKVFPGVDEDDLLDGYPSLWAQVLRMDYDIIEDAAFKWWLKKNGYDAAYVTGDGVQNVFVVSPSQVEIVEVEGRWDKKAGDVMLYDQHNPANNEIKQPGKDVNYRAEGPTTYSTEPDEKQGIVPGGRVPSRQLDNAPPASSRVIPDSMKQTLEDSYTKAAAATIPTILDNCGPAVTDRSKGIKVKRKRLSPSGMSTWSVQGSSGEVYTVRVKPIRKNKRYKIISKMPVKVSCSCQFWRWQGPEHWGKTNDFLYGKPRGTASVPVIRDPLGEHWACKHLIAVLQYVNKWRFAADAEWSYEGPFAPLPDEGRVAARYLEAKRQLWWHGTSGKNLRSVLKQGLIPTGDLVFDVEVDPDRAGGRSIKTFGGIYFSSQWFTAYSSAGGANRKSFGVISGPTPYSRVIIGATLDNRSPGIMLDEDDMLGGVERLMGRAFDDVSRKVRLPEDLVDRWSGGVKAGFYGKSHRFLLEDADYGDLPAKYLDHMASKYPKLEGRVKRQRGALESAIRDMLAGYSVHLLEVWYHRYKDDQTKKIQGYIESAGRRGSPDLVRQHEDELKQHLADEREVKGSFQLLQKATNRVGQMMREATEMPEGAWRHNIRVMRPVTYRGKDRILMVASITDRDSQVWKDAGHFSSTADIIFHYGAQQRKPFIDKYEDRVGGIARVLDASGKVLEIIDKRGQLEERGWPTDLWGPAPQAYRDVAASALTTDSPFRR